MIIGDVLSVKVDLLVVQCTSGSPFQNLEPMWSLIMNCTVNTSLVLFQFSFLEIRSTTFTFTWTKSIFYIYQLIVLISNLYSLGVDVELHPHGIAHIFLKMY